MIEALTFQQPAHGVEKRMDNDSSEEEGGKRALGEEVEEEEGTNSISRANTEHVDVESHVSISMSPVTGHSVTGHSRSGPNQASSPARLPSQHTKSETLDSSQRSINASTYPVEFFRYLSTVPVCLCVCASVCVRVRVWVWVCVCVCV